MGSKDGYAPSIARAWGVPVPEVLHLNDPGLWGCIWTCLSSSQGSIAVAGVIDSWVHEEPRALFERLKRWNYDGGDTETAAAALCKIAATYGGGEIGGFKGPHKLRPSVDGFIPNRRTLAARVRRFRWPVPVAAEKTCASKAKVPAGAWVYIDPPYQGTSGYLNHFSRQSVVSVAQRLVQEGCHVAVSEGEPIVELLDLGWTAHSLTAERRGQTRRNTRSGAEWLMVSSE